MPFQVSELRKTTQLGHEKTHHNGELAAANHGFLNRVKNAAAKDAGRKPELREYYILQELTQLPDDNMIGGVETDPVFEDWKKWLEAIPIPNKFQRMFGIFMRWLDS